MLVVNKSQQKWTQLNVHHLWRRRAYFLKNYLDGQICEHSFKKILLGATSGDHIGSSSSVINKLLMLNKNTVKTARVILNPN